MLVTDGATIAIGSGTTALAFARADRGPPADGDHQRPRRRERPARPRRHRADRPRRRRPPAHALDARPPRRARHARAAGRHAVHGDRGDQRRPGPHERLGARDPHRPRAAPDGPLGGRAGGRVEVRARRARATCSGWARSTSSSPTTASRRRRSPPSRATGVRVVVARGRARADDAGDGSRRAPMIEGRVPSEIREGPDAIRATLSSALPEARRVAAAWLARRRSPRVRDRQRDELPLVPGVRGPLPAARGARRPRRRSRSPPAAFRTYPSRARAAGRRRRHLVVGGVPRRRRRRRGRPRPRAVRRRRPRAGIDARRASPPTSCSRPAGRRRSRS